MLARSGISPTNQKTSEIVPYVETANTSHTSGLRKFGQYDIVFGYGNNQYASHGRPRWNTGNMPAQATAKSVIASAKRLIELRHDCRSNSRMAEISVPAWPIPIHQTKLTIANPQPTGILMPQTPTPLRNSQVAEAIRFCSTTNEIRKPKIHPSVVLRLRTMPPILSETDARLWPSSITGPTSIRSGSSTGCCMVASWPPRLPLPDSGSESRRDRWFADACSTLPEANSSARRT